MEERSIVNSPTIVVRMNLCISTALTPRIEPTTEEVRNTFLHFFGEPFMRNETMVSRKPAGDLNAIAIGQSAHKKWVQNAGSGARESKKANRSSISVITITKGSITIPDNLLQEQIDRVGAAEQRKPSVIDCEKHDLQNCGGGGRRPAGATRRVRGADQI
jgi:hypothetical protein